MSNRREPYYMAELCDTPLSKIKGWLFKLPNLACPAVFACIVLFKIQKPRIIKVDKRRHNKMQYISAYIDFGACRYWKMNIKCPENK